MYTYWYMVYTRYLWKESLRLFNLWGTRNPELGTVVATSTHTYSLGNKLGGTRATKELGTVAATFTHTNSFARCMYSIYTEPL